VRALNGEYSLMSARKSEGREEIGHVQSSTTPGASYYVFEVYHTII